MDIATGPFTITPASDNVTITLPYSWLPMGTAPKDRALILRTDDYGAIEGYWNIDRWHSRHFGHLFPTGWMNLPETDL